MTDNNHTGRYVFISYSSQDQAFVERLRQHLRENQVEYWVDREGIPPGASNWEHAIRRAIQGASNVIYVVTPNSFESNVVQGEIALAEMQGLTIYPVWAAGEHFINCVPLKMNKAQYIDMRGESYVVGMGHLIDAIKQHNIERAYTPPEVQPLPEGEEPRNPYKGLNAFTREDARDFFGRERLVGELAKMVEDRIQTNSRLLAVIGPSGSGKSSVVMAGLLPRLENNAIEGSEHWVYLSPFTPGGDPLTELSYVLREQKPPTYEKTLRMELNAANGLGLAKIARDLVGDDPDRYVVVYIDQFEELFTLVDDEAEREQFINTIVAAATLPDSPVIVVLTLRADFYDRPMNYNLLAELVQNNNRSVLPLTLGELNDAITLPAQLDDVQLEFERELVAAIAFDLLEFRVPADKTTSLAGALPLLQFALSQLYHHREGNKLTMAAYEAMGRVSGAIGSHAEVEFNKLPEVQDDVLHRVFYYLVTVNEHGTPTRRRSKRSVITQGNAAAERLVEMLVQNRLLVAGKDEMLEVAHEALLRSWGRLAEWIDSNARRIQALQKVQASAADWEREGRPDRLLWDYEELQPVYEAIDHLKIKLDPVVQEFTRPQMDRLLEDFETTPEYRQMGIIDRWREIGADAASALVRALAYAKGEQVVEAIDRALWEEPEAAEAALLTALTNPDANVREAAAQAVGRLGVVKAVDPLLKNVQDPQKQGCLAEIEALAALHETAKGHPQAVPALLDVLRDQENRYGSERRAAAHALGLLVGKKNTQAVQTLLEVLYGEKRDRHWEVRYEVVVALGELRATSAIDSLIAKSRGNEKGESYHVQRAAVEALGKLRNSQATSSLINAAVDASDDIRYAAVKALASLKSENVLSMLTYHLKDHAPKVRQATAEALGELGHLYALKPLSDALETEKTSAVRVAIVEALRAYPHRTDAAAVLRSTLEDDTPAVKAAAAEGLGLMKPDNRNVHSLIKALKEKDYAVKEAAIRSLGKLKVTQAASKLLKELTRMRRWQTRFWTAVALSEIGEESIAEDLRKVLEEKDSDAAFAAAVVLAGLGENTDRVKKELLSALTDPRIEARCIAAAALGKLKDAETLPALLREMRNQNDAVRQSIADAIRGMGDDERVKTALDDLLQHPFQGVRQTARMAQKG